MNKANLVNSSRSYQYCGLKHTNRTVANKPRRCRNCGEHVDKRLSRVCGDADGIVHECPNCTTTAEAIKRGGAAGLEVRRHGGVGR